MAAFKEEYPFVGVYVTKDLHTKIRYLAFKKGTSMSKLLMALMMAATKDITIEEATFKEIKNVEVDTNTKT